MATNKGKTKKHIREQMKNTKFILHDFDYITFKQAQEICPELTKDQFEQKNNKLVFSFKECYRFLEVLYDWFVNNEEAIFFQDFFYFALPTAVSEGTVKPFAFSVTKDVLNQIKAHFKVLDAKIKVIKDIQDYRIFKKGLSGEFYQGLVSLWLKTHSKEDWTETIKQEIVNKTQILNIDPLEKTDED